jgi:hypothetical protein
MCIMRNFCLCILLTSDVLSLRSKFSPQYPVLKHPKQCSFLTTRDQVSDTHDMSGKILSTSVL